MHAARLINLLALLLLYGVLTAQWRETQLSRLGPAEGLSTSIFDITQDSTGYLYLAGNAGMYRYDGSQFQFFAHDPLNENSIGPGDVYAIRATNDGLIWMTLRFGGLNSYDPETGDFVRYPLPELYPGSNPGAHAIYEDIEGTLWVGGSLFRLLTFDRKQRTFHVYSPEWIDATKTNRRWTILSIIPDKQEPHLLWLSILDYQSRDSPLDSYGLVSFDTHTKKFHEHPCGGIINYIDSAGVLWGAYWGNWITKYDPATRNCDSISYSYVYEDLLVTPLSHDITRYQDQLLVSTSLGLLQYQENKPFDIIAQPRSSYESFQRFFVDRSNNLWICARQGAYVLNPADQHIQFFSLSQFGVDVRLYPARLAYVDNVVYFTHLNTPQFPNLYQIPLDKTKNDEAMNVDVGFRVQSIVADHRQRIWLNGNGALHFFDPNTSHTSRVTLKSTSEGPIPGLSKMESNPDGWIVGNNSNTFLWFHADEHILHKLSAGQLSEISKTDVNAIQGFSIGNNKNAYVFTDRVYQINLLTGNVLHLKYDLAVNPNQQDIQYVGEDANGNIWMSSFVLVGKYHLAGDSLILLDAFTTDDGMISPTSIELHIDDQQRIWAFSISGMNCIDPISREVRFFGINEGLPDSWVDPIQVLSISDGRIATHCANGMIVFDPEALWNSVTSTSETVVISRIRIGGDALQSMTSINNLRLLKLKPAHRVVDIEFQGLAFPADVRMEYSYRIIGLQSDWVSLGKNKLVTLSDLSPGTYTFQVKSGKPHSETPVKSLAILVGTPFYLRWWFIVLTVIGFAAGVFGIVQWRMRRIRKQEEARTEVNKKIAELELKALRSQMNPHFMFNSLNSIKNYILHAEPKLAAEYLSNFAHLIRMILQNSREKLISLKDELETLVLYVDLEKLRFDDQFEFVYHVDENIQLESIKIPPMLLQPYVENAIWHGLMHKENRGRLLLEFRRIGDKIACIIEDNGVGRAKAQELKSLSATKYKSMGIGITKDRIEIMNKMDALGITAEIFDKYDDRGEAAGTRVTVTIPVAQDLYS